MIWSYILVLLLGVLIGNNKSRNWIEKKAREGWERVSKKEGTNGKS